MYNLRIRSRHPSHNILRRNKRLKFNSKITYRLGSKTTTFHKNELNPIQSVINSSNKFIMKQLFKDNNVKSTNFYFLNNLPKNNFPLLAKKKFGSKGKGMVKINNQEELDNFLNTNTTNYYFEEYFSGCREYRLHVSELDCFYSCRKMRKRDAENRWYFNSTNCVWITEKIKITDDNDIFIKFSENDNELFNKPESWNEIIEHCQKAIKAVGLDLGAVDVRVNKKGDFRILETNSAPAFGEITSKMYINHLNKLINHKF